MARTPGYLIADAVTKAINAAVLSWPREDETCDVVQAERAHIFDPDLEDLDTIVCVVLDRESATSIMTRSHAATDTTISVVVARRLDGTAEEKLTQGDEVKQFAADIADLLQFSDLSATVPALAGVYFTNATIGPHVMPEQLRNQHVLSTMITLDYVEKH